MAIGRRIFIISTIIVIFSEILRRRGVKSENTTGL
jgi:hypothetical protein